MTDAGAIVDHVWDLLRQGGWFMLILFAMGQAGWYLALERWWTYRRVAVPPAGWSDAPAASPDELARRLHDAVGGRGPFAELSRELPALRREGETALVRKAREIVGHVGNGLNRHLGTLAALSAAAP